MKQCPKVGGEETAVLFVESEGSITADLLPKVAALFACIRVVVGVECFLDLGAESGQLVFAIKAGVKGGAGLGKGQAFKLVIRKACAA